MPPSGGIFVSNLFIGCVGWSGFLYQPHDRINGGHEKNADSKE